MNPSELIDQEIKNLNDWRGNLIAKIRQLIHEADPEIAEEWKWSVPVFSHNGQVCAVGSFKDHIKINFFKGASLEDKNNLFNSGLEAKKTRAIDIYETDTLNELALKELLKSAVKQNS